VHESHGGTITLSSVPGFELKIAPGSATFPDGSHSGIVSVTVVHTDKVPMTPNFGQQPRFIVTIQPSGVRFNPPAAITFPNLDGLAPGSITELYSFDHDVGSFVAIGTGTVSEDGTVIVSDSGVGIVKGGWHCGGNPKTVGSSASLKLTVLPEKVKEPEGETFEIIANGVPPLDARYVWQIIADKDTPSNFITIIDDNDILTTIPPNGVTDLENCFSQENPPDSGEYPIIFDKGCSTKLKANKHGSGKILVTFICTTTGKSVTREIKVVVTQKFKINVKSFIPFNHVLLYPLSLLVLDVYDVTIPLPTNPISIPFRIFGGEDRSFSPTSTSYRTKQVVNVTTADPITIGKPVNLVGETKEYAVYALLDGKITDSDVPIDTGVGKTDDMHITVTRINEDSVEVEMTGSASDPLTPLAPHIDWCYTIIIKTIEGVSTYTLTGGNDNFPAYEIHINDKIIHHFTPLKGPWSLFGSCMGAPVDPQPKTDIIDP